MYELSLQHFQNALREETNDQTKSLISQKMKEYSDRAAEISSTYKKESKPIEMVTAPPMIDWTSLQKAEKEKWKEFDTGTSNQRGVFKDLENAINTIELANKEDMNANYTAAVELYGVALDYFMKAMEGEKSTEVKKAISEKVHQYITRAEQIKELLRAKSRAELKRSNTSSIKIEVSQAASGFVEQAIKAATEGTELDDAEKYDSAIQQYQIAVNMFAQALKVETNPNVKTMMQEKMVKYTARAEMLRQYLSTGSVVGNSSVQFGLKPGEKYKPPPLVKKRSKKEKKTWKKF